MVEYQCQIDQGIGLIFFSILCVKSLLYIIVYIYIDKTGAVVDGMHFCTTINRPLLLHEGACSSAPLP